MKPTFVSRAKDKAYLKLLKTPIWKIAEQMNDPLGLHRWRVYGGPVGGKNAHEDVLKMTGV